MKNIKTSLVIVALTTMIGSTSTFAQAQTGYSGSTVQTEERRSTNYLPLLGLLGLVGLMGRKRDEDSRRDVSR